MPNTRSKKTRSRPKSPRTKSTRTKSPRTKKHSKPSKKGLRFLRQKAGDFFGSLTYAN